MATYRFRGGAMAQLWMSYDIPAPGLDAYGEVRLGRGDGWQEAFTQPGFDPLDPVSAPRLAAYAAELTDLLRAVAAGGRPLVDGSEGLPCSKRPKSRPARGRAVPVGTGGTSG
jgi:hypothetical protein